MQRGDLATRLVGFHLVVHNLRPTVLARDAVPAADLLVRLEPQPWHYPSAVAALPLAPFADCVVVVQVSHCDQAGALQTTGRPPPALPFMGCQLLPLDWGMAVLTTTGAAQLMCGAFHDGYGCVAVLAPGLPDAVPVDGRGRDGVPGPSVDTAHQYHDGVPDLPNLRPLLHVPARPHNTGQHASRAVRNAQKKKNNNCWPPLKLGPQHERGTAVGHRPTGIKCRQ